MKDIINKAKQLALEEITKYDIPLFLFNSSNEHGQEIAIKLNADKDIVLLGTILMDIKLGEAAKNNKLKEHVQMGVEFTKKFLEQFEIPEDIKLKIINCVEAHHGTKAYICKEAEICANADCYKFLLLKNVIGYIADKVKKGMQLNEAIQFAKDKMEEKHKILSLDICKKELEEHYQNLKKVFEGI